MNMTSNCDVKKSAHQIQMTTICHWMTHLQWKFCAYATFVTCTLGLAVWLLPITGAQCYSLRFLVTNRTITRKPLIGDFTFVQGCLTF